MEVPSDNNILRSISITPTNTDRADRIRSEVPRRIVDKYFFKCMYTPFFYVIIFD